MQISNCGMKWGSSRRCAAFPRSPWPPSRETDPVGRCYQLLLENFQSSLLVTFSSPLQGVLRLMVTWRFWCVEPEIKQSFLCKVAFVGWWMIQVYHKELDEDCFLCLLTRCCSTCYNFLLRSCKGIFGRKKGPALQETYISQNVPYSAFPKGIFNDSVSLIVIL